jgi:hypothetical protein
MIFKIFLGGLFSFLLIFSGHLGAEADPFETKVRMVTKDIDGARAYLTARIHAPQEAVWQAFTDFNNHAEKYPQLDGSFCVQAIHTQEIIKKKLLNASTVKKEYRSKRCDPLQIRQKDKKWAMHVYQQFDYPFPLADRWFIGNIHFDETGAKAKGEFKMKGELIYGRQKIYQVSFTFKPHPKNPQHTLVNGDLWMDPGGIIMGWMIRAASDVIIPEYIRKLNHESRLRMAEY